jgi:hypothetical protein
VDLVEDVFEQDGLRLISAADLCNNRFQAIQDRCPFDGPSSSKTTGRNSMGCHSLTNAASFSQGPPTRPLKIVSSASRCAGVADSSIMIVSVHPHGRSRSAPSLTRNPKSVRSRGHPMDATRRFQPPRLRAFLEILDARSHPALPRRGIR